ncbi:MAG: methyltransferase domain-containing protein [Ornithinimicrobium sp.]
MVSPTPNRTTQRVYRLLAPAYDVLSLEQLLYRTGRTAGVNALHLREGQHVLDIGCGTGLTMPVLSQAIGPTGHIIGVDSNPSMLRKAAQRTITADRTLIEADAQDLDRETLNEHRVNEPIEAAIFAYTLSLMPDSATAWQSVTRLLVPGARVAIVDVAPPTRGGPPARAAAWAFTRIGRSDIDAHPWQDLQQSCTNIEHYVFKGGHVEAWAGNLPT